MYVNFPPPLIRYLMRGRGLEDKALEAMGGATSKSIIVIIDNLYF